MRLHRTAQKTLAVLAFLILASSAEAETISVQVQSLKRGDYFAYTSSQFGPYIQVFKGNRRGLYVFEVFKGNSTGGAPVFTLHTDAKGQNVRRTNRDGAVEKFSPHDCRRTVGRCSYTYTNTTGQKFKNSSLIETTNSGFNLSAFDSNGNIYQERKYDLRPDGIAKKLTIKNSNGKTERIRLTKSNRE